MANAGGAWDNAKKIVETELKQKGTPLHDATVVGDTVGDPFKDTSSVALNPIIKFTTLFGLLAVELAVSLAEQQGAGLTRVLAAVFSADCAGIYLALVLWHADRGGKLIFWGGAAGREVAIRPGFIQHFGCLGFSPEPRGSIRAVPRGVVPRSERNFSRPCSAILQGQGFGHKRLARLTSSRHNILWLTRIWLSHLRG